MDALYFLLLALGIVVVAELGDKTQLMTISFASRYSRRTIYIAAVLGMGIITVIGVAIGVALYASLPIFYVKIVSAAIFIFFGVWVLLKKEERLEEKEIPEKKVFIQTFILFILAEFGDKTQLAVISLTATSGHPWSVLVGALIGFALVVAVGVLIGKEIGKRVKLEWIVLASGIIFIIIGVILAVEAFLSG
ncbi:MAG: TMEM165/GDT1 family protein [Methanomassiliicoccales archaeon]|nr:MAG: TMEM165/GDT1 family protein [Methanomassiliicoccales archaeon]